ncbi:SSS family transporter [Virgibacillus natechei]|uniref:SSS family transporter n=1 Tax=Virgibacillus natechei TaxID=1216297 RepID=A0ABS4IJK9_9BACI|nr:sodium:solute symporter family protein [Virgibacillus natechei]MBP1971133.1 SSS family transporter [Virgibacillus natechei]UZD12181.1 sodium:solute symporter family protein [Virgibacillus natechei]
MLDDNNTLAWLVLGALFGYFLLTTWLGKRGSVHSKSMKGFAIAKGKVSPWIVGISFGASYASANLFIGVPGWAYTYGAPVLWYSLGCFGVSWIGLLLFAKTFWEQGQKKEGSLTLPQWLGIRYQSKALQVIVAVLILFNIYYIVAQNVGLATMFETIIGIPYTWGIIIGVTITIVYVSMGGAFAQLITDGIQGMVMSVISVLLFISMLWSIGGGWNVLGNLQTQMGAIDGSMLASTSQDGPFHSVFAILSIQWLLFSFALLPHLMNKVLTVEKKEDLRKFTLSSGITLFVLSTFSVFAGMAARITVPNLSTPDSAVPAYIMEVFPTILVILLLVGIVSAILSTTDSLYLGMTTSIGNDLYKVLVVPILYKNKDTSIKNLDQKSVRVSRISLIVIGGVSLYMSIDRPDSLALLAQIGTSAILSGIAAPITLSYFWKKAHRTGALASVVLGPTCFIFLVGTGINEQVFEAMFYSSLLGYTAMIFISVLAPYLEKQKKTYYLKRHAR